MYNYDALIREAALPGILETVFVKPYEDLAALATEDNTIYEGDYITQVIEVGVTSPARNYTKADVDPISGSFETVEAKWKKNFSETAFEVHNIDISNARGKGGTKAVVDLFQHAMKKEKDQLWQLVYNNVYAQWKLDLLASGGYSDNNLSRVTYPTLLPYNEITATPITVGLTRGLMNGAVLNKSTTGPETYNLVMERTVYNKFLPQAQLLTTWTMNDKTQGQTVSGGWRKLGDFEDSPLTSVQGMTTGDVLYTRKVDTRIHYHRALAVTLVPSGRDSIKGIMRLGLNGYIQNPGIQGMMTNKG